METSALFLFKNATKDY